MDISEIRKSLKNCDLFKGLKDAGIEKIAELCGVESYEAGEYVFRQGDFGERIYIIAEGHIFLERSMDLGRRRANAVIGAFGRDRALGCWSSILGEPHHLMSSAICKKFTKVIFIKGTDLRGVMLSDTALGFKVLEKICLLLRDRLQGVFGALEKI